MEVPEHRHRLLHANVRVEDVVDGVVGAQELLHRGHAQGDDLVDDLEYLSNIMFFALFSASIRAFSQTKVVAHPHAMMTTAARACAAINWYPPVEKDVEKREGF